MERKKISDAWQEVFSKPPYVILSLILAIVFYSATALLSHFRFLTFESCFPVIVGFHRTLMPLSLISTILISLLFGFLFSLLIYKTKMIKSSSGEVSVIATVGIFLGILAPGCAACGIGLISVLGLGAVAISFLPFRGLELSILSILLLIIAIVKISKNINRGMVCEIDTQKLKGGKNGRKHNNKKI